MSWVGVEKDAEFEREGELERETRKDSDSTRKPVFQQYKSWIMIDQNEHYFMAFRSKQKLN